MQPRLTDLLLRQRVALQRVREGIARRGAGGARPGGGGDGLAAGEGGAGYGVVEGLWGGFRGWCCGEGGLGFGGRGGGAEEFYFVRDGAGEVREGFLDVGRVVVGFF